MTEQAPSPDPRIWHVRVGGKSYGPYPEPQLMAWIRRNAFPPEAKFSCKGKWMCASEAIALIASGDSEPVLLEVVEEPEIPTSAVAAVAPSASPDGQAPAGSPAGPAPAAPVPPTQAALAEPPAAAPRRDRIVVIGRRASGKTVYLAALYRHLWKSRDGMTMKALSGRVHRELTGIYETLRHGEWPAATLKTTLAHMEVEVTYKGQTRVLVGLDYAGEVFRDAFVNDDSESPEAKALISHIDRAAAVILLVDPAVAVSGDADAFVDDDFGIVQAIRRIRDWPGGQKVPIALVLTKADRNVHLFRGKENTKDFISTHYPALVRTLGRCRYFHASAVQAKRDREGRLRPSADSVPVNIVEPLKYCLDVLKQYDDEQQAAAEQDAKQHAVEEYLRAQQAAQRRQQRDFAIFIIALITLGICIVGLILVFHL
jgi:hypothetical protein